MCPSDEACLIKYEIMCRIFDYTATNKTQRQSMQPSETSRCQWGSDPDKKIRFLRVLQNFLSSLAAGLIEI